MREKLIELVGQVQDCGCDVTDVVEMNYVENNVLVDHLIANGVTLDNQVSSSKWISVTERLPSGHEKVLAITGSRLVFLGKYSHKKWFDMEWNCYRHGTTHWMPLPKPPEGE